MPTPEAKRNRYLVLITCVIVLLTALFVNGAGYVVGGKRIEQNKKAGQTNKRIACETKGTLHDYLTSDANLRKAQAQNSRNSLKAQSKFIKDTQALLIVLRKAPNQKGLTPIILYFEDQIALQETQKLNTGKNITLSEAAADYFNLLSTLLRC